MASGKDTSVLWWWKCTVYRGSTEKSPSACSNMVSTAATGSNVPSIAALRLLLHLVACIASFGLGLKVAKEPLLTGFSSYNPLLLSEGSARPGVKLIGNEIEHPAPPPAAGKSSNVHPGRHQILIRPWPHPDPSELVAAQAIIDRVQKEQRKLFEAERKKQEVIVITTVTCSSRSLHLEALARTLSIARASITWIVVEAGGVSNTTAEVLQECRVKHFHIGSKFALGETNLRIRGLSLLREKKLEGIVIFVDELAIASLDLFDEVQKVNWVATFPVGFPVVGSLQQDAGKPSGTVSSRTGTGMLVQRPVCDDLTNAQSIVRGWELVLDAWQQKIPLVSEWSGIALNAKLLWGEESFDWVERWDKWSRIENATLVGSSTGFIKDVKVVEPLASCGEDVLAWSLRSNACFNDGYLHRWVIKPPLQVVVPSRRTPWPTYSEAPAWAPEARPAKLLKGGSRKPPNELPSRKKTKTTSH